jgi:hypothetical protein
MYGSTIVPLADGVYIAHDLTLVKKRETKAHQDVHQEQKVRRVVHGSDFPPGMGMGMLSNGVKGGKKKKKKKKREHKSHMTWIGTMKRK